jgi:voltage-gated potassium channel Kch
VRRFGSQAYYGDATRLDLLRSAGAADAKILVIALDEVKDSLQVVEHARRHFPQLTIFARARNRRHAHLLMDRGVSHIIRETFHSSLHLSEDVLLELGIPLAEVKRTVEIFAERDERLLLDTHSFYKDEKQMIQTTKQITEELQSLLEADQAKA